MKVIRETCLIYLVIGGVIMVGDIFKDDIFYQWYKIKFNFQGFDKKDKYKIFLFFLYNNR